MGFLKKALLGVAGLIAILTLVGFFLPRIVMVERSIVINVPVEAVYQQVTNLRNFNSWSPWHNRDPNTRYIFSGGNASVGSTMNWSSEHPEVGNGSQRIVALNAPHEVEIKLDFGEDGSADSYFKIDSLAKEKSRVTWGFTTDMGLNPLARYFGLMFDGWIGTDYEEGLDNLKDILESSE